jgi:hypothetical protein
MKIRDIILFLILLIFISCSDEDNPIITDPNSLYSSDELICDYHDSIPAPFATYKKSIILKFSQKTFSKVKFEGNFDSYYMHDTVGVYNPNITFGLMKDTGSYQPNDTLTLLYRTLGNFSVVDSIKYNLNESFNVVFFMTIRYAQRGDFIKVKNLKISKID